MRFIAAALAATVVLATPASAATLQEKQEFTTEYLNKHLTPEEPWAHRDRLRVTDGFAFRPTLLREAQVRFVVTHGYVKPPKPEPVTVADFPVTANIGASVGISADWDAIANCEGGGNWSMVKPDADPYYFVLQFHPNTWLAYGGTQAELNAGVAPSRSRLIQVAEAVLAGQGPGAWPNCFHYL